MRRSLTAIAAAAVLSVVPLAANAQEGTLAEVKEAGVLRACFAQVSPEAFKDPDTGEWQGIFVDLTRELADWMGVELEIVEVQWNTAVLAIKRGDCEMFGGSMVYNAPRAAEIAYVTPAWAKGVNGLVASETAGMFESPEDLNDPDVTIAVVSGSSENEVATRQFPDAEVLALQVNSNIQILESVRRGDADIAFLPTITLTWWLAVPENGEWGQMAFPGMEFASAPNGWTARYGDDDWVRFLDAYVEWARASGLVEGLYDEYIELTNPFVETN